MYRIDPFNASSIISVSGLSSYLKSLLDLNDILQNIWVRGEVSNCKTYASGHCYFTLKEGEAQLSCVFFKTARLRSSAPDLRDGMALAVNGRISYYERDGKLQCYVDEVKSLGAGALFQRFEELKLRLATEGLFDEERKRALPSQPAVIGIVTSPQAAALRDILYMLRKRYPLGRVILSPALVQGAEAPASIVTALDLLNEHAEAEVIIVGRGGGSLEDLWAFNEEIVVRAIGRSRIPVVSAVGHETDFTIADFVADQRAPTPTAAASAVVPDIADWQEDILEKQSELTFLIQEHLSDLATDVKQAQRNLQHLSPQGLIASRRQQLDDSMERLQTQMEHVLSLQRERLRSLILQLHSLSPLLTLGRGYAVVRRDSDQQVVSSVQQVQLGEQLTIQLRDGYLSANICP